MSNVTSNHIHEGLLSSNQIEDLVSQLVAEEISIHQQNQKLKIAQERALQQARKAREAELAAYRTQALQAYGQAAVEGFNGRVDSYGLSANEASVSPNASNPWAADLSDKAAQEEVSNFFGPQFSFPEEKKKKKFFSKKKKSADDTAGFHTAVDMPALSDYEDVADEYLSGKSFKERMSAITKGVKNVLAERLGQTMEDMMSDMPVIQRADGSVGDIGESWWKDATKQENLHGSQETRGEGISQNQNQAFGPRQVTEDQLQRASLAKRLGRFEENPFALNQEVAGFSEGTWDESLANMDRNAEENLALTMGNLMSATNMGALLEMDDEASWFETDEIEGLEAPTGFLAFRVPGGHPEVSDTSSYVDYLVKEELSESNSPLVKKHVATHLRVIEGGSGRIQKAI